MPIFSSPYNLKPKYNKNAYYKSNENLTQIKKTETIYSNKDSTNVEEDKSPKNKKNNSQNYFFELFGLKLYYDDILLISLLFFLYEENVKDYELFFSIILLLLS